MLRFIGNIIALFLTFTCSVLPQDIFPPPEVKKKIDARKTALPIVVDGKLNEDAWASGSAASDFLQVEPFQGKLPAFDTEVKILFDDENLYVGAYCRDTMGASGLRVPNLQRDFDLYAHDAFCVVVDAFQDERNCLAFHVNPYGSQRDIQAFDDALYDNDWDVIWRVRTHIADSGWHVEMAIPWSSMRYRDSSRTWGINFMRVIRRFNQISAWSPYPRAYSLYRMTYAGTLQNVLPPSPSLNMRFQPYLVTKSDRGQPVKFQTGGELKWAATPNLVADLTINTDFAQADVDRQVVNLRRFSVFFPERRQFFLEGASMFSVGLPEVVEPFFSRRIGLDNNRDAVPIDVGMRAVYRSEDRGIGAMAALQRESESSPGSAFGVLRYVQNIGSGNRIGAMATLRRDNGRGGAADVYRSTSVVDGFWRISNPLVMRGMASFNTNPETLDGYAGFLQMRYAANNAVIDWKQAVISPDYDPAVGQVSRSNIIYTFPGAYIVYRPSWLPSWLRSIEPGVNLYLYHGVQNKEFQEGLLELFPLYMIFQDGGILSASIEINRQVLTAPFILPTDADAVLPGTYDYRRYVFNYSSDQSYWLSGSIKCSAGGYYGGTLRSSDMRFRIAPVPNIAVAVNWQWNEFLDVVQPGAYRNTHLMAPEIRLALNPRIQLIGFWQYNTAVNRSVWNGRLSWEFAPLSFLYVVVNDQRPTQGLAGSESSQGIVKFTYLGQL